MNTELEVLKIIFQDSNPPAARQRKKHRDKTPVSLISSSLGFGTDYIRLICRSLARRNLIRVFKPDWYKITSKGQKALERKGLIKRVSRKRSLKIESPTWERVQLPVACPVKSNKLKYKFSEPKTEKLKLGKKIEKVASFLGKLKI